MTMEQKKMEQKELEQAQAETKKGEKKEEKKENQKKHFNYVLLNDFDFIYSKFRFLNYDSLLW